MKVVLIAAASSIHTARWANGLREAGCEVHLISQHPATEHYNGDVRLHILPYRGELGYFLMVPQVRRILREVNPDIVNAHYASGYGTTARLAGKRPWILSVWGSDVYDFPHKSFLHRWLVKSNLLAADRVASTSHCMAEVTNILAPNLENIFVTPFGVDMKVYEAIEPVSPSNNQSLVIGTVKTMAVKYGIDTLIEAFALLLKQLKEENSELADSLQLRLVGGGPNLDKYNLLARKLRVSDKVNFVGRVPHSEVPNELAKMDIYVALSRLDSESFGVAIIEAEAAGRPVVVSDAGGLPEVTIDGVTGYVVPRENPERAAQALKQLVLDPALRKEMGEAGRNHVAKKYQWPQCIDTMLDVYNCVIKSYQAN